MAVPYIFANTPGGSSIPLANLDANFSYLSSSPLITGNLTVNGLTTLNGGVTISGSITINGQSVSPTSVTGTGALVFNTGPTLVAPILGIPASGTLTNCTGLPITTGVAGLGVGVSTFLSSPTSANLLAAISGDTGTGNLVFSDNPVLVTPNIGTPSSGNLANCTGYPSTSLSGIVPISLGGTGAINQAAALNNLLPTQSIGQAGYVLTTNGAGNVTWNLNEAAGTVSSVTLNPSATGLTVNGGTSPVTITTTGTFTLGGVLSATNGGTGVSSLGSGVSTALPNAVNASGGLITYSAYAPASGKQLTVNNSIALSGTDSATYTLPAVTSNIGYLELPPNPQTGPYTTVLSDSGKFVQFLTGGSTITIAANASVPYPIGTVLTFVNLTGLSTSIACGDTMYFAEVGTIGTRTLSTAGLATAIKVGTTIWIISGSGLS